MKMLFKGWRWVAKGILLLVLVAVTAWLGQRVQAARVERDRLEATLTKLPEELSAAVANEVTLARQQPALEQLARFVVRREEVGVVASVLEGEGNKRQVTVVITDVREEEVRDATGAVVPAGGPLRDVRIAGSVRGTPARLLSWLAEVEQLPYLLRLDDWKIGVIQATGTDGGQQSAPISSPIPSETNAMLTFTIRLSIQHETYPQP